MRWSVCGRTRRRTRGRSAVEKFHPGFGVAIERAHEHGILRISEIKDRLHCRPRRLERPRIDDIPAIDDGKIMTDDSTKNIAEHSGRRVCVLGPAEYATVGLMGTNPLGAVRAERDRAPIRQLREALAACPQRCEQYFALHARGAMTATATLHRLTRSQSNG